jgi:hypothetical protein
VPQSRPAYARLKGLDNGRLSEPEIGLLDRPVLSELRRGPGADDPAVFQHVDSIRQSEAVMHVLLDQQRRR